MVPKIQPFAASLGLVFLPMVPLYWSSSFSPYPCYFVSQKLCTRGSSCPTPSLTTSLGQIFRIQLRRQLLNKTCMLKFLCFLVSYGFPLYTRVFMCFFQTTVVFVHVYFSLSCKTLNVKARSVSLVIKTIPSIQYTVKNYMGNISAQIIIW